MVVTKLVAAGADANAKDRVRTNSAKSLFVMLDLALLDNKFKPRSCVFSQYGRTPLHVAVAGRRGACVKALLAAGADANVKDEVRTNK